VMHELSPLDLHVGMSVPTTTTEGEGQIIAPSPPLVSITSRHKSISVGQNLSKSTEKSVVYVSQITPEERLTVPVGSNFKRKLSADFDDADDEYDTETEAMISARIGSTSGKSRTSKRSVVVRKDYLNSEAGIKEVHAHHVICDGCGKTVKLHATKPYRTEAWDKHKNGCPNLTGRKRIKIVKKTVEHVEVSIFQFSNDENRQHVLDARRFTADQQFFFTEAPPFNQRWVRKARAIKSC
jgi:hypothetical protein